MKRVGVLIGAALCLGLVSRDAMPEGARFAQTVFAHVCDTMKGSCPLTLQLPVGYPCTCIIDGHEVAGTAH
jgi:hypothetical protein